MLLQLLDDGRLTDGQGRTVDFRNMVVIMTSNMGSHLFREYERPEKLRPLLMQELRNTLRPEFLNRIDEVVDLPAARARARSRGSSTSSSAPAARGWQDAARSSSRSPTRPRRCSAAKGYDPTYGARPLKRTIQRLVQDPLALRLLEREFVEGDTVAVDADGDQIVFRKEVTAEVVN